MKLIIIYFWNIHIDFVIFVIFENIQMNMQIVPRMIIMAEPT